MSLLRSSRCPSQLLTFLGWYTSTVPPPAAFPARPKRLVSTYCSSSRLFIFFPRSSFDFQYIDLISPIPLALLCPIRANNLNAALCTNNTPTSPSSSRHLTIRPAWTSTTPSLVVFQYIYHHLNQSAAFLLLLLLPTTQLLSIKLKEKC